MKPETKSDTPRTDKAETVFDYWANKDFEASFRGSHLDSDDPEPPDGFEVARQLERELNEAKPWMMFFRDQKTLGEIAKELGTSVYNYVMSFGRAAKFVCEETEVGRKNLAKELEEATAEVTRVHMLFQEISGASQIAVLEAERKLNEATQWRPVESAPFNTDVLVIDFQCGEQVVRIGCKFDEGDWIETTEHRSIKSPTHWMPLPKPPK